MIIIKNILKLILKILYKVEVKNTCNYFKATDKTLIVCNHQSFLDALIMGLFLPELPYFAINTFIAEKWWLKPFLKFINYFIIDPANPMATKKIIEQIKNNHKCLIFPEGRITVTGSLMKIYEGSAMVADKSGAMILPVRIEGAQYTPFSRLKGKVKIRLFPKITLNILEPQIFKIEKEIYGRERRALAGQKFYELMTTIFFDSSDCNQTLFQSLINARNIYGKKLPIINDISRKPLNYDQLCLKSIILGKEIQNETKLNDYVGILLPNMISTIVTFFAMQAYSRIPVLLNFTSGINNILSACKTAKLKIVYTSKVFIEKAKLENEINILVNHNIKIIYLEDFKDRVTTYKKISGYFYYNLFLNYHFKKFKPDANQPCVVLFTSGSENTPKGVVLTHKNIQANRHQLAALVDFNPADKVFNTLPIYHSFGLTGGTLLPILSGINIFFYPSPLHYRIIPEIIYDINATILFGTDTFLSGYARFAHPYDFYSVRYVFAGAEKLKEETRRLYSDKYGVRIFEGYGATETSPVIATNTPMHSKAGSVGIMMPRIEYKLEPVAGIEDGGKLLVKGPNIMKGYLLADNPGIIKTINDGWYDTGDIISIDKQGFVTIKGRVKRFAKIAGEMVSLSVLEDCADQLWPKEKHAAINLPDDKKGEQIILISEYKNANKSDLGKFIKQKGLSELYIPKSIKHIDKIPVLGTGKIDYIKLKEIMNKL